MAYVLPTKAINPSEVGDSYHLALGLTSPGQTSPDRIFGYLMVDGTKFEQNTDLNSKSALTQYSSPNLIDRDIVNWPRVTDGDFSGGGFQINWLDASRYWDSDLDVRTAGYLFLNPAWVRTKIQTGFAGFPVQCCPFGNTIVSTFRTDPVNAAGESFPGFGAGVIYIDTDGDLLFGSDGTNIKYYAGAGVWTLVGGGACTAHTMMWVVDQGTAGKFVYYKTGGDRNLLKLDLALNTRDIIVPTGGGPGGAFGSGRIIVDLTGFAAGVAIVTSDPNGTGFDVWQHDGAQLSRMVRINGLIPGGICSCLGQLYVTAYSSNGWDPPVLIRVGSGDFEVVARLGLPFVKQVLSQLGAPVSTEEFVYFPVFVPQFNGISAVNYVAAYNVRTGALAHFGNMDGADSIQTNASVVGGYPRVIAPMGRSVAFPFTNVSDGWLQYQANSFYFPPVTTLYEPSGWLISSRFDFATPGIEKLFRRIVVHHTALRAGEKVQVNAYVDADPTGLSTVSPPKPAGATTENLTVGSDTTVLTLPERSLGFCMVYALKLTAGTGQVTSPSIYYVSVEMAVSWTWKFTVDCSSRRRLLNGDEDKQGLRAKDLVMLVRFAWENALPLTFYHPDGTAYTAVIEDAAFESDNPLNRVTPEMAADLEGRWTLTLRDAIV